VEKYWEFNNPLGRFRASLVQQLQGCFLIMPVLRGHMLLLQFSQGQHLLRFPVGNKHHERTF
jgi:hypothetical protein